MDADLQTDPEDFNLLLKDIANYEMVTGIRDRKDSFFKNLQSKIANGYRRMMTNDGIADTGCPLKVMHLMQPKMPLFNGMHRFMPALIYCKTEKSSKFPYAIIPAWRKIQISFMEQADRAFYRLFCLSMDERTIY